MFLLWHDFWEMFIPKFLDLYTSPQMLVFRCWEFIGILIALGIAIKDEYWPYICKHIILALIVVCPITLSYLRIIPAWTMIIPDIILAIHLVVIVPLTGIAIFGTFAIIGVTISDYWKKVKKYFSKKIKKF